ncbi:MAG: redoxin domain-containing protein [Anaerolineae bacterium]|nr:redoxin domain-containing protein [Anaerolineae bacterium]
MLSACAKQPGLIPDSDYNIPADSPATEGEPTEVDEEKLDQYSGQVPAPEFPTDLDWVNVAAPLTLDDLRGKVVLLDFWTYGCINCIHMIPVLERLEEKYPDELIVIGVHSAKFDNEGQTENIEQIVQRYGLRHPVINDDEFLVWQAYGVRAWPTLALLDPRGHIYAIDAGEIPFEPLDRIIGEMIAAFDSAGEINREPLDIVPEGSGDPDTLLRYPGKVLVDAESHRLFIADSGHHRIVIADLDSYEVLDVIGNGHQGYADGDFDAAQFDKPQGMALDGDTLYIADTYNHVIREADLGSRTVTTIIGTGEQGSGIPSNTVGDPTAISLRSPWDVELNGRGLLYIAMAGTHQIWAYEIEADRLRVEVGDGREALVNTTPHNSSLAQPSGLYFTDNLLYFADSESSSVRVVDIDANKVRTVSGPENNTLFDFGDVDGEVGESRLQHPLAVTGTYEGLIFIADTYNSRIKTLDPETDITTTIFGLGGDGGFADGDSSTAEFDEPGGLSYADGKLYVADTNNHAIRVIDLEEGIVSTVEFPNPEALMIEEAPVTVVGGVQDADETLEEQQVAAGEGEIVFRVSLPDGFKINDLVESEIRPSSTGGKVLIDEADARVVIDDTREAHIPATFEAGDDTLYADMTLYYCRTGEEALCFLDTLTVEVLVSVIEGAEGDMLTVEHEIIPPPDV